MKTAITTVDIRNYVRDQFDNYEFDSDQVREEAIEKMTQLVADSAKFDPELALGYHVKIDDAVWAEAQESVL